MTALSGAAFSGPTEHSSKTAAGPAAGFDYLDTVKLSIIMAAYNEQRTIAQAVMSVLETPYPCEFELIVVDDGSTDHTARILRSLDNPRATVIRHPRNRGKGAALLSAASAATGTHLIPFDADLEYDPGDLPGLIAPVLQRRCDVVYGVRLFGANTRYQSYRHAMANRALTLAANLLFDSYISDMHTCLKLLPLGLFRELELSEQGFALDTQITAKLLRLGVRPFEVPVSYHSRSIAGGKKIRWRDGLECLRVLARVRLEAARASESCQSWWDVPGPTDTRGLECTAALDFSRAS